jgi:hypothetical protein
MLESRDPDLESAKQILARLERYAAQVRAGAINAPEAPAPKHPTATATEVRSNDLPWLHIPQPATRGIDDQLPTLSQPSTQRRTVSRLRIDPATVDLFPYDLAAAIITCALTVFAFAAIGSGFGVIVTVVLVVAGIAARQLRYFPSVGVKALLGVGVGLVLVFFS